MNDPIPEPLRGADVIPWAHPVTRALNALHDKIGAPTRNERDRRGSASPDMGCWKIISSTREEESENEGESETMEKPVRVFANQYYLDGEVMHELDLEDAVEDFVCQGELGEGEEYMVISPAVEGYTPDKANVSGAMGTADVEETVTYSKNA